MPPRNSTLIAAKIVQPCRVLPTQRPNVYVSAAGMQRIRNISSRLLNGVGFSKGCAELALRKPPPFVPSSLIASWLAIGP